MRNFFLKKSTRLILSLLMVATLALVACSDKEEKTPVVPPVLVPPALSNIADLEIAFPGQDDEIDEDLIVVLPEVKFTATSTPLHDVRAVPLSHFVLDYDGENFAKLHSYQIVAYDGATSRRDENKDLYWDTFKNGHYVIDFTRSYFHELSQESNYSYNVNMAREIRFYRTVMVVKPDGEEVMFQVNILSHENRINPQNSNNVERSFKLSDLITNYVTLTPQNFEYIITATDGSSATLEWHQLQGACYSRVIERVFFPTIEDFTGAMRLRDLMKVELFNRYDELDVKG